MTSSSSSPSTDEHSNSANACGYIDIGVNLLDPMYSGIYRGKYRHEPDMSEILQRASMYNVQKMIITAGTIEESEGAYDVVKQLRENSKRYDNLVDKGDSNKSHTIQFASSVGIHPTRCQQEFGFDSELSSEDEEKQIQNKIQQLRTLIQKGLDSEVSTVVTLGELGLDYARTEFCSIEHQKRGLLLQLELALEFPQLPLFIHNRDTGMDLYELLKEHYCDKIVMNKKSDTIGDGSATQLFPMGVVHSFDGPLDSALKFIDLGMYIGINGCSLKTPENIEVIQQIPLSKIVLETDGPWCDIRPSHASFPYVQTKFETKQEKKFELGCCVKNRTEPCHVIQVAEVIAGVKGLSIEEVQEVCWRNTHDLFQLI